MCSCCHKPMARLRRRVRLLAPVRSRASGSTACPFRPAISGEAPASRQRATGNWCAGWLLRVVVARWVASTFFSPPPQSLQGATDGWRTHLQFGLSSDVGLQLGERRIRLCSDQLLHRHDMALQGARASSGVRQGGAAAGAAPAAQELFNERFTDGEFVSQFLLRVIIMVFIKPDDALTQVVREGEGHTSFSLKLCRTRN